MRNSSCDTEARRPRLGAEAAPPGDTHISWWFLPLGLPWSPGRSHQLGSCPGQASAALCAHQLHLAGPSGREHQWF